MWNAGLLWGQRNDPGRSRIPPETAWVLSVRHAVYEARYNRARKQDAPAGCVAVEEYWDMQQLCTYPCSANPANLSNRSRHSQMISSNNIGCLTFLGHWMGDRPKTQTVQTQVQYFVDARPRKKRKKKTSPLWQRAPRSAGGRNAPHYAGSECPVRKFCCTSHGLLHPRLQIP